MLKMSFFIERLICLCYYEIVLFVRRKVNHPIGYNRIRLIRLIHHAIGSFDKTVLIDSCIRRKRVNESDVRSFRGLDRTHSSIVCIMYVSHLKPCTVSGKSARSECGKSSLMSQLRKRIVLVHELGQLRRSEELLYSRSNRLNVNQGLRSNFINILRGHSFTNHSLHTGKTDTILVL